MISETHRSSMRVRVALLATAVLLVVVGAGLALAAQGVWTAAEMDFLRRVNLAHTPQLDSVALGINWLFGPTVAPALVVVGCSVVFLVERKALPALQFLVIVTLPWMGNEAIKALVGRPRPDIASLPHILVLEPGGLSFPSGHTSFAACLLLGMILTIRGRRWRAPLIATAIVVVLATAGSRVYLGVHYPTDVAASIVYSVATVSLINVVWLLLMTHWARRRPGAPAVHVVRGASDDR
ncbi:membrane-associated phospholipid phosphatase [Cryobacterium sp. MP_3.1]|uniref:phosphatase PAP2 family protein n=1 Tax=Cryobacterium sp. MP_3.1 TaxID=3071711 RepID=UPI002E0C15C2|nr:membrane-associated phospholipid phosphatase [Cryobacterium sp. MP_3.1]